MSIIFAVMVIAGFAISALTGDITLATNSATEGAKQAIELCFSMCGIYALWMGIINIAQKAGLVEKISRAFKRPLAFLFPDVAKDTKALGLVALNLSANMLGLGNAATPSGIAAMQQLQTHNNSKTTASLAMCMLIIINSSSVQIIPTGVIAIRSAAGSANPAAVVFSSLLASAASLFFAIVFAKIAEKISRRQI